MDTLWQIDQRIEDFNRQVAEYLDFCVNPETGEVELDTEAFEKWQKETFDALQMERTEKIENIALFRKNEAATVDMLDKEIKALQERKKAHTANVQRMDKLLEYATGGDKFETAKCLVKFTTSTSTDVEDESKFIEWAMKRGKKFLSFGKPKPNKTEIKAALVAGKKIPFCAINKNKNIQVK